MRPALDTLRTGSRTGARYLSPALVSSPAPVVRARLYGHPRAYLAATIATAFRGCSADPLAGQLHECALAPNGPTVTDLLTKHGWHFECHACAEFVTRERHPEAIVEGEDPDAPKVYCNAECRRVAEERRARIAEVRT